MILRYFPTVQTHDLAWKHLLVELQLVIQGYNLKWHSRWKLCFIDKQIHK